MATIKTVSIRLATVLAGSITLSGILLAPGAAFAYYGALPNYSLPSYQACSGRYDSNCLIEVTNFLNGSSYQGYQNNLNSYQYPSQSSYNTANGYANQNSYYPSYSNSYNSYTPYNYSNTNSYYQPSYQYSAPSYNYSSTPYQSGYNYQYSYGYNYQNGQQSYQYSTPSYNYGYYHY